MAEAAENNVTPISADSKLTDEQKRRIEANRQAALARKKNLEQATQLGGA